MIVGIDEVGRGCLAGPVCVAAVILDSPIAGLNDSKKLTKLKRDELSRVVKQNGLLVRLGWASSGFVDSYGITEALRQAAFKALLSLPDSNIDHILLDGKHNYLRHPKVTTIVGGDGLEPSISAASIIAKVARDAYMTKIHQLFPVYGFDKHVGYGTSKHLLAIKAHGPCRLHRMSFAPLKDNYVD